MQRYFRRIEVRAQELGNHRRKYLYAIDRWGQELVDRGFRLIEVPEGELATQASNVLALGPRRGLMLEGNPVTRQRLEEAGCEMLTYRGHEISLKAEGGPTCLTQPILRGRES